MVRWRLFAGSAACPHTSCCVKSRWRLIRIARVDAPVLSRAVGWFRIRADPHLNSFTGGFLESFVKQLAKGGPLWQCLCAYCIFFVGLIQLQTECEKLCEDKRVSRTLSPSLFLLGLLLLPVSVEDFGLNFYITGEQTGKEVASNLIEYFQHQIFRFKPPKILYTQIHRNGTLACNSSLVELCFPVC